VALNAVTHVREAVRPSTLKQQKCKKKNLKRAQNFAVAQDELTVTRPTPHAGQLLHGKKVGNTPRQKFKRDKKNRNTLSPSIRQSISGSKHLLWRQDLRTSALASAPRTKPASHEKHGMVTNYTQKEKKMKRK
jgi:hypothetical protein